jgi:hypothetical protein
MFDTIVNHDTVRPAQIALDVLGVLVLRVLSPAPSRDNTAMRFSLFDAPTRSTY